MGAKNGQLIVFWAVVVCACLGATGCLVSQEDAPIRVGSKASLPADSALQSSLTSRETARRLYERISGGALTAAQLDQMEGLVSSGQSGQVADAALQSDIFYDFTLKQWFTPWTNREESSLVDFNDSTALLVGSVNLGISFDRVLYDDILFVAPNGTPNVATYSRTSNNHYQNLQTQVLSGSFHLKSLQAVSQAANVAAGGADAADTGGLSTNPADGHVAGILTLRGWGEATLSAGTNRRPIQNIMKHFLCHEMAEVSDASRNDSGVRKDVDRSPGGDFTVYKNQCRGCHAALDPLSRAFARYNFNNNRVSRSGGIQNKMNNNPNVFPDGYQVTDDNWENLWVAGPNSKLGWSGADQGSGPQTLGQMFGQSRAFSECMVKKVYKKVCLKDPSEGAIDSLADQFEQNGKNMKDLFKRVALTGGCLQ